MPQPKGCIPWNKGKTDIYSEETLQKMSVSGKNRPPILEKTRLKLSKTNSGEKNNMFDVHRYGKDAPNWKDGASSERKLSFGTKEYKQWRTKVFERDDFNCQICNQKKSGNLEAHHILPWATFPESPGLRHNISNGITLCKECHQSIRTHEMQMAKYLMGKNKEKEHESSLER